MRNPIFFFSLQFVVGLLLSAKKKRSLFTSNLVDSEDKNSDEVSLLAYL